MSINASATTNGAFLPFLQNAVVPDTTKPYTSISTATGPFNGQISNIVNYGVDICKVNFINT